ncbi:altronate dehydratase [Burkholderia sp. TJI49]|nr:altronate dehydratase [Burkholderia sp. TJI49]
MLDGGGRIDALGATLFRMMLDAASGRATRSELHGYGQNEFVPWQIGAIT